MTQVQLTSIPIVTIVVCVVLGLNVIFGALNGFVKKISGLAAFFLAGILVTFLLPSVTGWLRTTPVYDFIREQCENIGGNIAKNEISGALSGQGIQSGDGTGDFAGDGSASSVIDAVTSDDGSGNLDRSKIKEQLRLLGYDPSIIDSMSDAELESYAQQLVGAYAGMIQPAVIMSIPAAGMPVNMGIPVAGLQGKMEASFLYPLMLLSDSGGYSEAGRYLSDPSATGGYTGEGGYSSDPSVSGGYTGEDSYSSDQSAQVNNVSSLFSQITENMSRIDQTKLIESLPLPQSIKDQMETFNNESGYKKLGATDFGSYVINYFASLIMNIAAYVVTLFISWLVIRIILGALSVFSRLPIMGAVDHLLGMVIGLIQGIIIVWGLFLVLSMFSTTPIGARLMEEIYKSPILSTLYNINPFLNIAANAIKAIMQV